MACGGVPKKSCTSHLMPVEAWQRAVSTTSEGRRVLSEVRLENCTQVWEVGQSWTACDSRLRKIVLHTCSNLSKPVQTYSQYSDHVCSSRNVVFCTFECCYSSVLRPILVKLHILTSLIESFPMVYGLWSCIEIEMSITLGAHASRPSIEIASSTVIF